MTRLSIPCSIAIPSDERALGDLMDDALESLRVVRQALRNVFNESKDKDVSAILSILGRTVDLKLEPVAETLSKARPIE